MWQGQLQRVLWEWWGFQGSLCTTSRAIYRYEYDGIIICCFHWIQKNHEFDLILCFWSQKYRLGKSQPLETCSDNKQEGDSYSVSGLAVMAWLVVVFSLGFGITKPWCSLLVQVTVKSRTVMVISARKSALGPRIRWLSNSYKQSKYLNVFLYIDVACEQLCTSVMTRIFIDNKCCV